jgi:general secretion pathway protein A
MSDLYKKHFGLSGAPFSIAPDTQYIYMSRQHREALGHLLYGATGGGGFVLLTGDIGAGKTTMCRSMLEMMPKHCDVAFIYNPKLTVDGLLSTICKEFRIKVPPTDCNTQGYIDHINSYLLDSHAQFRNAILIIDEAQNLSIDVLEQLRLLTNLETNERKLLQVILLGQPELRDMLARPVLKQFAQRIIARHHLGPLEKSEVKPYIAHRLKVAGCERELFTAGAMARIHGLTGGVPRLMNLLCDRALLGAYVEDKPQVDNKILANAAKEVTTKMVPLKQPWRDWMPVAIGSLIGALGLGAGYYQMHEARLLSQTQSMQKNSSNVEPNSALPAPKKIQYNQIINERTAQAVAPANAAETQSAESESSAVKR